MREEQQLGSRGAALPESEPGPSRKEGLWERECKEVWVGGAEGGF